MSDVDKLPAEKLFKLLNDRTQNFWSLLANVIIDLEKLDTELHAQIQSLRILRQLLREVPELAQSRLKRLERQTGANDRSVV